MRKFFRILVLCVIIFLSVFLLKKYYYKDYKGAEFKRSNLNCNIKYRGLEKAVDFAFDEKNNYYIAYKDRIQLIRDDGKSYDILKQKNMNISSIEYDNNKLYIASNCSIYCYNIQDDSLKEIFKTLPNLGDNKRSKLRIRGDYIYISIGSVTNSGVVGEDNLWLKESPYVHDISPKAITLKGINFENGKTGAFQSYGTKSLNGQIIPEHFPGNASVIIYNLKTGGAETFAWGIRNITAMDFLNDGKLMAAVGGMENRGARPVKGDNDYIYEIKKGHWYGWPDYSGGDPITSPKFKGSPKGLFFILENHPTTNPPAPFYQHNNLSSITALSVDTYGKFQEKNRIYFYDKKDDKIYSFNGAGTAMEEVKFGNDSNIISLKFNEKSLLLLDENLGYLYSIEKGLINTGLEINKNIYAYAVLVLVLGIFVLLKFQKDS